MLWKLRKIWIGLLVVAPAVYAADQAPLIRSADFRSGWGSAEIGYSGVLHGRVAPPVYRQPAPPPDADPDTIQAHLTPGWAFAIGTNRRGQRRIWRMERPLGTERMKWSDWGALPSGFEASSFTFSHGAVWMIGKRLGRPCLHRASAQMDSPVWSAAGFPPLEKVLSLQLTNSGKLAARGVDKSGKTSWYSGEFVGGGRQVSWSETVLPSALDFQSLSPPVESPLFCGEVDLGGFAQILTLSWQAQGEQEPTIRYRISPAEGAPFGPWSTRISNRLLDIGQRGRYVEYQIQFSPGSEKKVGEVRVNYLFPEDGRPGPTTGTPSSANEEESRPPRDAQAHSSQTQKKHQKRKGADSSPPSPSPSSVSQPKTPDENQSGKRNPNADSPNPSNGGNSPTKDGPAHTSSPNKTDHSENNPQSLSNANSQWSESQTGGAPSSRKPPSPRNSSSRNNGKGNATNSPPEKGKTEDAPSTTAPNGNKAPGAPDRSLSSNDLSENLPVAGVGGSGSPRAAQSGSSESDVGKTGDSSGQPAANGSGRTRESESPPPDQTGENTEKRHPKGDSTANFPGPTKESKTETIPPRERQSENETEVARGGSHPGNAFAGLSSVETSQMREANRFDLPWTRLGVYGGCGWLTLIPLFLFLLRRRKKDRKKGEETPGKDSGDGRDPQSTNPLHSPEQTQILRRQEAMKEVAEGVESCSTLQRSINRSGMTALAFLGNRALYVLNNRGHIYRSVILGGRFQTSRRVGATPIYCQEAQIVVGEDVIFFLAPSVDSGASQLFSAPLDQRGRIGRWSVLSLPRLTDPPGRLWIEGKHLFITWQKNNRSAVFVARIRSGSELRAWKHVTDLPAGVRLESAVVSKGRCLIAGRSRWNGSVEVFAVALGGSKRVTQLGGFDHVRGQTSLVAGVDRVILLDGGDRPGRAQIHLAKLSDRGRFISRTSRSAGFYPALNSLCGVAVGDRILVAGRSTCKSHHDTPTSSYTTYLSLPPQAA